MRFIATFQLYDFLDTLVSLATAFVLGALIGAERQYRQRTAGLRTNVLVAVGASAFVDLAMHLDGADGAFASSPMWCRGSASWAPASS
jgi:putative Mg2+ transporter-C (MgtC) family protein